MAKAVTHRALVYARVSSDKQAKQQYNLPNQRAKLNGYCERNGLPVLREFVDRDSARTDDRPAFQEMLEFCRKNRNKITHVVVADLSRLARNVVDQGTTIAELRQLGITLVSVDEPNLDDTAAGKLSANLLGAINQFFSDSLSERTKYRMKAGFQSGRFLHNAPVGYLNVEKNLARDPERAPLVKKAYELFASGNYATGDAVLKLVTGLGLRTRKGNPMTKQSFARMLQNPIYAGWLVSGEDRVRGAHEPLVSDGLFQRVQERLNGKSRPHKALNEDFPLRGIVRCERCDNKLTAGFVKGRKEKYPRYWCWNKECKAVGVSRESIEGQFVAILERIQPTADLLARLPELAAREWELRKGRIAKDAEVLSKRLAEQRTLNHKAITAKLNSELSADDFDALKKNITEEIARIEGEITSLDSERSTMEDLMQQAKVQIVNLAETWKAGNVNQKQELAKAFWPEGIWYSQHLTLFEPRNSKLLQLFTSYLQDSGNVGVPDGI
jgi:site-specific DNA recombinase